MRGEEGFSLIEMVVALAVMALVSSAIVLSMAGGGESLPAEADRLAEDMSAARDAALIENRIVTVELSSDGYRTARLSRLSAPTGSSLVPWHGGTSVSTEHGRLPVVIRFDSLGLADATRFTLYRGGRTATIAIDDAGEIQRLADAK